MVTLKDVRDDLRDAKLALERGQANPSIIAATYDKAIGDLQDIEAALTQVMIDVETSHKGKGDGV